MDIEDLSQTQLLLLTVLVSFVTSIATGVLVASLLAQTPTTVTQTVNRIVDHTIETVTTQVPVVGNQPSTPSTEDLLVSAISALGARSVTLYRDADQRSAIGTGVYLPVFRTVFTVSGDTTSRAHIVFSDGTLVEATRENTEGSLVLYRLAADATLPSVPAVRMVALADLKQGQTVIGIAADGSAATGIITRLAAEGVYADLPLSVPTGSAIVNLAGDIVGISGGGGLYLPTDRMITLSQTTE